MSIKVYKSILTVTDKTFISLPQVYITQPLYHFIPSYLKSVFLIYMVEIAWPSKARYFDLKYG